MVSHKISESFFMNEKYPGILIIFQDFKLPVGIPTPGYINLITHKSRVNNRLSMTVPGVGI